MRLVVLSGMVVLLFVLPSPGLQQVLVEADIHHVGDESLADYGLFHLMPEPEGLTWTSSVFDLPFLTQGNAYLVIDLVDVDMSTTYFMLNNMYVNALPHCDAHDEWANDQYVAISSALLQPQSNVMQIQVGQEAVNYDDILFRNVRIEYTPEPTSLSLLALGSLALRRRRLWRIG